MNRKSLTTKTVLRVLSPKIDENNFGTGARAGREIFIFQHFNGLESLQEQTDWKIMLRGGVKKKKLVLLGGAHHKVATPPSPSCGEGTNFFCRKIFLSLESPETGKKFIRLESEIFTPL